MGLRNLNKGDEQRDDLFIMTRFLNTFNALVLVFRTVAGDKLSRSATSAIVNPSRYNSFKTDRL